MRSHAEGTDFYRVKIDFTNTEGKEFTVHCGPYTKEYVARRILRDESEYYDRYKHVKEHSGVVQKLMPVFEECCCCLTLEWMDV